MQLRLATLFLASAIGAQTYIVDAANGPGTDFTSIAAATAAVPDGSLLQVRAGSYGDFTIQSKSLRVIGEPGVRIVGSTGQRPAHIDAIGPGQSVVLQHLRISHVLGPGTIWCTNSAGSILLDDCRDDQSTTFGAKVVAANCDQLHLRNCTFSPYSAPSLDVNRCRTTVVACFLASVTSWPILQTGGQCDLAFSTLNSGLTSGVMTMLGGELVIRASTTLTCGGLGGPGHAVTGSGNVRIDPSAQLVNMLPQPFDPGIAVTQVAMPWLVSFPGTLGGTASATLHGTGAAALVLGLPTTPTTVPGIIEPLWLASGSLIPNVAGAAPLTGSYAVPNAPWVLGILLGWQGVTFGPSAGLQLSNAGVCAHG